ncbi:hypothetical protein [Bradyrhizobium erythrophlei]|nr:hypothetical protein [Bradyrhizobium erythrophlei]
MPEIRQEDASAAVARIYSDIKRASGTPLVNLIYRHLATVPGGLEWVWGCIRMNWGYDGLLRAAAAMPVANVTIILPTSLWRIVGLSDSDLTGIRSLVRQYNLTNAANIIGITALAHVARSPACCSNDAMLDWMEVPSGAPIAEIPSVPKLDALAPDIRSLVYFVNGLGEEGQPTMVASLFRHLALWPSSLAVTAALLTPLAQSGELTRLRQETIRAAERIAGELISSPGVGFPPPPQAAREAVLRALDLFRTTLIAKMLPVGQILSQALKPA